jgi:3',5'-cyclic AMP phosphodiesterase CpdA
MKRLVWLACGLLTCARMADANEHTYVPAGAPAKVACGDATPGWQKPELDDRAWGTRPSDVDAGTGCAGTLFLRFRFDGASELARLATLTLRIRYAHGYAAYLNGVEIARRRLDPNADAAALATDYHGPEWERVFVTPSPGLLHAGGNLLAVEVHPRTAGREPVVDAELSGADGVRIVRGPYLQRLGAREATVLFDTDLPAIGAIRFGATDRYGAQVAEPAPQLHHALRLDGLSPASLVHYRVTARTPPDPGHEGPPVVDTADAGDAVFHTPPERGGPLRFVVYGDVRSGHDVHALLDRQLLDEDPDLALVTGDVVDRGSDEGDWERFFEIAAQLLRSLAIFVAPGNHEYARLGRGAASFMHYFRKPLRAGEEEVGWYSFDVAGVHFVALDSNEYRSPRQLAWFDRDLADARKRGARALFVWAHEPPFSSGMHGDNLIAIHDYVPIMERHKVTMFFGGHDHHYERGRVGGLDYVVTGGGGAELRLLKCNKPGTKPCPPHVLSVANEHHYVLVEVMPSFFRLCPKRPDGTPIEACVELPLRR